MGALTPTVYYIDTRADTRTGTNSFEKQKKLLLVVCSTIHLIEARVVVLQVMFSSIALLVFQEQHGLFLFVSFVRMHKHARMHLSILAPSYVGAVLDIYKRERKGRNDRK